MTYNTDKAARYRKMDEQLDTRSTYKRKVQYVKSLCTMKCFCDVLDLACGTGRYWHSMVNTKSLVGVDNSAPMLKESEHYYRSNLPGTPINIERVCADINKVQFPNGSFDLIFCIGALVEHIRFEQNILEHTYNWLRHDGIFMFTTKGKNVTPLDVANKLIQSKYPIFKIDDDSKKSNCLYVVAYKGENSL